MDGFRGRSRLKHRVLMKNSGSRFDDVGERDEYVKLVQIKLICDFFFFFEQINFDLILISF